mmetsp:Transcript_24869/g.34822  ORF Transcript_24869/g.34822 Transcript_24869/m.34822 type:complete len:516 (+) Transcript_24869:1142-2689(+)
MCTRVPLRLNSSNVIFQQTHSKLSLNIRVGNYRQVKRSFHKNADFKNLRQYQVSTKLFSTVELKMSSCHQRRYIFSYISKLFTFSKEKKIEKLWSEAKTVFMDDPNKALSLLEEALELVGDSDDIETIFNLKCFISTCYEKVGNDQSALKFSDEALSLKPDNATALAMKGTLLIKQRKYDEALILLDEAIKLNPIDFKLYSNRASTFLQMGRYEQAISDADEALKLSSKTAWLPHLIKGRAFQKLGKHTEAIQSLEECIKINPSGLDAYIFKSNSLLSLEKFNEVISFIDESTKTLPEMLSRLLLENKAIALMRQGNAEESLKLFNQALAFDPHNINLIFNSGVAHMEAKKFDPAIRLFDNVMQRLPPAFYLNQVAKYKKALAKAQLGYFEEALGLLDELSFSKEISREKIHLGKAYCFNKMSRAPDALLEVESCLSMNPKNSVALLYKGQALSTLGKPTEALEALNQSIAVNPNDLAAYQQKAIVLESLGKIQEAVDCMKEAVGKKEAPVTSLQ